MQVIIMDLYSKLNSFAPNLSYLTRECSTDHYSPEAISDFPPNEDPVYILGSKYSSLYELEEIRQDVRTKLWMTYRRGFPSISESSFTSDSGWGCMLRCGQMVLAQALVNCHLGRQWRWTYADHDSIRRLLMSDARQREELEKYLAYRQILRLFADLKTAPYSIHQIALMGVCEGKNVGQWFGPNTVAQVLKKLSVFDKMNNIQIYVALDNVVFVEDIKKLCKLVPNETSETANQWKPLLLFIPLRLGLTDINPIYFRALKSSFSFPQTLGILGGRPNHALYFIGCCGDDLVYLDPHTTQPAVLNLATTVDELKEMLERRQKLVDVVDEEMEPCDSFVLMADDVSYHCERANRMPISMLDPSLALCFLCKTEEEFNQWGNLAMTKLVATTSNGSKTDEQQPPQPLFEILQTRPSGWRIFDECDEGECSDVAAKQYHPNNSHYHHHHHHSCSNGKRQSNINPDGEDGDEDSGGNDSEFEIID